MSFLSSEASLGPGILTCVNLWLGSDSNCKVNLTFTTSGNDNLSISGMKKEAFINIYSVFFIFIFVDYLNILN